MKQSMHPIVENTFDEIMGILYKYNISEKDEIKIMDKLKRLYKGGQNHELAEDCVFYDEIIPEVVIK